jgi:hypothetical protein
MMHYQQNRDKNGAALATYEDVTPNWDVMIGGQIITIDQMIVSDSTRVTFKTNSDCQPRCPLSFC